MKNTVVIAIAALVIGLSLVAELRPVQAQNTAIAVNRYAMFMNDAGGHNYLLDTYTGSTWIMHKMNRKGRVIAIWVPNIKTDTFNEEERFTANSANQYNVTPLPAGSK